MYTLIFILALIAVLA